MEFIHIITNKQNYLLSTDKIKEVLKYPNIKPLAESSELIEGIISHKNKIIPIITIRKLLGFESFKEEQIKLFKKAENDHIIWVKEFESALKEKKPFTKSLDPHKCNLGIWIDEMMGCMRCNHDGFTDIIKSEIIPHHNALHYDGKKNLEKDQKDLTQKELSMIREHEANTINGLKKLGQEIHRLSAVVEQLIIYDIDGVDVGFIVDSVAGLHQLDEKNYNLGSDPLSKSNEYIHFLDHYESKEDLMFSMKFTREVDTLVEQWREKEIA